MACIWPGQAEGMAVLVRPTLDGTEPQTSGSHGLMLLNPTSAHELVSDRPPALVCWLRHPRSPPGQAADLTRGAQQPRTKNRRSSGSRLTYFRRSEPGGAGMKTIS